MRDATLILDSRALRHNAARVRACAPAARMLAMVKADAYGHGALAVSAQLATLTDALGVAFLEEALALRDGGIRTPIVLMEGVFSAYELAAAASLNLQIMVHQAAQLDLLAQHPPQTPLTVWLKVNSGMNRLGFRPEEAVTAYQRLEAMPGVERIVMCTHFAEADLPDSAVTRRQTDVFEQLTAALPALPRSMANSAAILSMPHTHHQWVRPGIMLYGSSPFADRSADALDLKPVMTLKSRVIALQTLNAGDTVGYGSLWQAPQATRLAVVAIGYGDGYPRHAANGTPVLIGGQRYPLVGRVSMDMLTVEVGQAAVTVGEDVILWGEGLPADEVAAHAGTISYELFCRLTARVNRLWR